MGSFQFGATVGQLIITE